MTSVSQKKGNDYELETSISRFIKEYKIGALLRCCRAEKEKGIPVLDVFRYLLCLVFSDRSMYMQLQTDSFKEDFSKNTVYRFLNSTRTNWLRFTTLLSERVVNHFMRTLEVMISVKDENGVIRTLPARIVYVRNKKKRKDWIALISTDTSLSEEDIIRIYGKRWQTEVFYKTCKSWLKLGSECQSLSYDALTAHVAIVFTRYILVSLEQRCNADERTICELFYVLHDELADITYNESYSRSNA